MPRLFVSHAVKDKELVHNFVDFICYAVRLDPERDVFCSSLPGQGFQTDGSLSGTLSPR